MDFPAFSDSGIQLPIHPKAIAFDMDGTLLDYDGHLSDSVQRAVQLIARSGIKVFLASGRVEEACVQHWRELHLDTPIASCNGAHIGFPGEKPFVDTRIGKTARDIVLELDQKHDLYVNYYVDNAIFTLHDGLERENYSRHFAPVSLSPGPDHILSLPLPSKCLCIVSESDQPRYIKLFSDALGENAAVTSSNARFIEAIPPGVNKGTALETLANWSGVPIEQFIAVGDAMNDLPMLEKAGFAISFKTGDPRIAEHVDMLLPPLWEDGMDILAKCVLGLTNSGRFLTPRSRRFFRK